ncbi:AAA family ATPase [Candidatus Pantoea formicae]|uniref:AAA family ATPase n=1 Tax=Candidatus Pantoea formicae TaxID=2608355 RepID=UPI003ED8A5B3
MKIATVDIENFRGIHKLRLELDEHLTLIIGSNGVGKSTLLDAMAILLSWLTARVRSPRGSGRSISESQIHNGSNTAIISLQPVGHFGEGWDVHKTRKGRISLKKPNMNLLRLLTENLRESITNFQGKCSIPVFAYYPINRAVIDIPLRIHGMHQSELLEAWDDSLTSAANFRSFFAWFRQQEDLEHQNYFEINKGIASSTVEFPNRSLQAVREALEDFLPEFSNFRVKRNPLRMVVMKSNEELNIEQLSDGEKCMIALVGDLARRFAIANPLLKDPLQGEAIVLIDEFDLHLHPQWQRSMIRQLPKTFPNSQFIVTTHSPQAIGEVNASQIRVLGRNKDGIIEVSQPAQSYGLTSDQVLDEIMTSNHLLSRNSDVSNQIEEIFDLIDDEKFQKAEQEIATLEDQVKGDLPEIIRARMRMSMLGWENPTQRPEPNNDSEDTGHDQD